MESLYADVALIQAWKVDTEGNMIFRGTTRTMQADIATASKLVIVEAENLVPAGSLDPNEIHVPGIYVDRIVVPGKYKKKIDKIVNK